MSEQTKEKENKHKKHKRSKSRSRSRSKDRRKDKDDKYKKNNRSNSRENQNHQDVFKHFSNKSSDYEEKKKQREEKRLQQQKEKELKYQQQQALLKKQKEPPKFEKITTAAPKMIEVIVNDRLGKKNRIKCCPEDTVGDLKKLIAVQTGTRPDKIRLQKWYTIFKDHIQLQDYEIHDGMGLEMYYN